MRNRKALFSALHSHLKRQPGGAEEEEIVLKGFKIPGLLSPSGYAAPNGAWNQLVRRVAIDMGLLTELAFESR